MTQPNDGGPAYPFVPNQQMKLDDGTWDQHTEYGEPGMTMRQAYKLAAINCMRFNPEIAHRPAERQLLVAAATLVAEDMVTEDAEFAERESKNE